MVQSVFQAKSEIIIKVSASAKKIYVKNIIFGILLHVVAKRVNIYQVLLTIQLLR